MNTRLGATEGTADVVVIGAGILGAGTAHELACHGHKVVVLERDAINRQGSGTTAGNLHIQAIHSRRPGQEVPVDVARLLPLQLAASNYWEALEEELGEPLELRRSGGLTVAETEDQFEDLRAKHELERAAGLPTELLTGDAARAEMPLLSHSVVAADWCALDGYANPLLVTPALLRAAVRAGARVHAFSPVTAIEQGAGSYLVRSGPSSWSTGAIINVAGPWLAEVAAMAGIRIDLSPVAIQMLLTERVPTCMDRLVQHVRDGLSVKQVSSGQILVGGGWPAREFVPSGRSPTSFASASANARLAARILPFLCQLRLLRAWAGPLAATPDEMPLVGAVPGVLPFLVAGGTYAFTLAPLWARCLCATFEGIAPPVAVDDLGPGRLMPVSYRSGQPVAAKEEP